MPLSTIPAVKQNLVTGLSGRPGLNGVQVSYGPPLPSPAREYIWIGDVEGQQAFAAQAAPNQRRETYAVKIIIGVTKEGQDSKAADDRCFVIFGELETQLRGDVTIGGVVNTGRVGVLRLTEYVAPDGMNRTAQLLVDVDCQAWI